jgi:hypothetical protein
VIICMLQLDVAEVEMDCGLMRLVTINTTLLVISQIKTSLDSLSCTYIHT